MSLSAFLPEDYQPNEPITVVAGRGDYPKMMVDHMAALGVSTRFIAMDGEASEELFERFPKEHRRRVKVGQVSKFLKSLKELESRYCVLVGQIRPGKLFKGLHPDVKALRILNSLKERNAETIYGAITAEMRAIGVEALDGRVFIDDQLASLGVMTGGKKRVSDDTLQHGIRIANEIARLDIGQGVVVKRGTTLCIEEYDGTDSMLKRAVRFDYGDKLFVKTVKPNQNYAIDVPVFGENTINSMIEGGVTVAALAAGKTIMVNKERVIEHAKKAGIQLLGF